MVGKFPEDDSKRREKVQNEVGSWLAKASESSNVIG